MSAQVSERGWSWLTAVRHHCSLSAGCGEVSAQVSERGWSWLVVGRRLLVWRHSQSGGEAAPRRLALCRELTLPPSDLAHRAELVQVGNTTSL